VNRPPSPSPERRERGQVIVVFALALVVIVAMVGLVIDGGSTYAQRRDMQNVADAAAMAGAYAYTNTPTQSAAITAAQSIATSNGYTNGVNGVTINVTVTTEDAFTTVKVDLGKPHQNSFAGVMGMSSWGVATTATAETGAPNAATGAAPIIFNTSAVSAASTGPTHEQPFGEPGTGNVSVPQTPTTFNWTVYCTANGNACNGNTNTVDGLINGSGRNTTVTLGELIGPLNAGSHTALFSDLANLVNQPPITVAIVDNSGAMKGWAMFQLTGSVGGSTKQIRGYFVSPMNPSNLSIVNGGGSGTSLFGGYTVRLVN